MDLNKVYKERIDNTNSYELLDIDYFYFYEKFDNQYLDYIISYINYNIDEIKKEEISKKDLDNAIKNIDEFVKSLPNGTYTESPRGNGPERYNFKIHELKYNGKRNRTNWVKSIIKTKLDIKVKVIDKEDEGTFDLKFYGKVSDYKKEKIEELRKTIITDEEYKKRIKNSKTDKRRAVIFENKKNKLMNEYHKQKLNYRSRCIEKATRIERWERLIWVINIEKYLREYESQNNLHIIRNPISSNDKFWENYKINAKDGLINNVFIIKNHLPYRVVKLKEKTPINTTNTFTKAVLKKYPYDEYEGIYHINKANDNLINIAKTYSFEPLEFFLLLSDTNLNDENINLSKDIRDIEFINDLEDIKDEFEIQLPVEQEDEEDDNFSIEGTGFNDLLDWSDEIDL